MSECKHDRRTALLDGVSCDDCGAFMADSGWGVASHKWFGSRAAADFFMRNGKEPEPQVDARIAALEAENERLRKALEFYADGKNYVRELVTEECGCCSYWHDEKIGAEGDQGEVARAALEAKP